MDAVRRISGATGLAAGRVASIETRAPTRGDGEVIELDLGITVYPPWDKGGRWRVRDDHMLRGEGTPLAGGRHKSR